MVAAMREAQLVAGAEGICLTEDDLTGYVELMASLSPESMPSMAQDRVNKKKIGGRALRRNGDKAGKKARFYSADK